MTTSKLNLVKKVIVRFVAGNRNLLALAKGKNLKPTGIWFGVTDLCNSHCTHCNIWQKKPTANPLTLAELEKTFSDPLLSDVEFIINSGGEAILRPDIVDLLKLEHRMFPRAQINLSTNGILPDKVISAVKAILLEECININVSISLDGVGEKHDQVRGTPGNFAKVDYLLKELKLLKAKYPDKLSIILGFTLSDLTLENWDEVRQYAEKMDVECMPQWYNQSSFYENENTREARAVNQEKMVAAVKNQPNTIIRERWLRLLDGKSIKFKCFAAQSFFVLQCDGNVSPCLSFWSDLMGNVREKPPSDIWKSREADNIRKKVAACQGCLNSWGVEWSASTSFYPRLWFYLRKPLAIIDRLKRKA